MVRWYNSRTINHVDALHERDVLPDLGLTSNRCNNADLLLPQCVDDGRLARVGVADHADRDLFAVAVQGRELAEKCDEGTFAEAVVDRSVEGYMLLDQNLLTMIFATYPMLETLCSNA